jgi:uncharacterized caspase-like protein
MDRRIQLSALPPVAPAVRAGRLVVATIGIDRYTGWPQLRNAVSDATGTAAMFTRLGFVEVVPPLLDEAATLEGMHRLVTADLAQLSSDDSLVVFFAGHGHTQTAAFEDVSVKTGYVIPVDAVMSGARAASSWLRLDSWLSDIARLPPRHILVVIDACHSGVALSALHKWRDEGARGGGDLAALQARRSRRVITSALDDQRAMDGGPYVGHSLFTGCLIEGLSGGLAERGQTVVTGTEIGQYLQRRVRSYPASTQTPDCGAFELDDRGDIVVPILASERVVPTTATERRVPAASVARGSRLGWRLALALTIVAIGAASGYSITHDAGSRTFDAVHEAPAGPSSAPARQPPAVATAQAPTAPPGIDDGDDGDDGSPVAAASGAATAVGHSDAIMAETRKAEELRANALADNEKTLVARIDQQLARPQRDARYLAYRVLRGQMFLLALSRTVGRPAKEYLPSVRGYLDNQLALARELQGGLSTIDSLAFVGRSGLTSADAKLAEEIGIMLPGEYAFLSAHLVMRDLAGLLMFGTPPFFGDIRFPGAICYYKLDPSWAAQSTRLLDNALDDIAAHERFYKERESIRTLHEYANVYLELGRPEQAIAKLQTVLTRYPKSHEFVATKDMLERIVAGDVAAPACAAPG